MLGRGRVRTHKHLYEYFFDSPNVYQTKEMFQTICKCTHKLKLHNVKCGVYICYQLISYNFTPSIYNQYCTFTSHLSTHCHHNHHHLHHRLDISYAYSSLTGLLCPYSFWKFWISFVYYCLFNNSILYLSI